MIWRMKSIAIDVSGLDHLHHEWFRLENPIATSWQQQVIDAITESYDWDDDMLRFFKRFRCIVHSEFFVDAAARGSKYGHIAYDDLMKSDAFVRKLDDELNRGAFLPEKHEWLGGTVNG
jgi:hypothetical protein